MHTTTAKDFLTEAAERYQENLIGSPAEEFLNARGINSEAAVTARLGWTSNPVAGHEQYLNMLAIPYWNASGVSAMKFRLVEDRGSGPRYLNMQGVTPGMYNAHAAVMSGAPYVAVCEGELDCVIAHYVCGVNAVAVAGVNNWKKHHARVLKGFRDIYILADNDDREDNPGQNVLAGTIISDISRARNVLLPRGSDVTDHVLANGEESLAALLGITDA
jgi:hypothetical protein